MDNYTEQIVPAKPGSGHYISLVISIVVMLLGVVSILFVGVFAIAMVLVGGIWLYFELSNSSIEYEYIFTNGDLEVAKIFQKSRRKEMCEVAEETVLSIVSYQSPRFQNDMEVKKDMSVYNFTSGEEDKKAEWYAFITKDKNVTNAYILELNDKNKEYIKNVYKNKVEK